MYEYVFRYVDMHALRKQICAVRNTYAHTHKSLILNMNMKRTKYQTATFHMIAIFPHLIGL